MKTNWNYYILQARKFVSKLFFIVIIKLINSHGVFRLSVTAYQLPSRGGKKEGELTWAHVNPNPICTWTAVMPGA